jgi:threonine/homoserine/homoserine lactone efflux protein
MPDLPLLPAFVFAVVVLLLIPGPNVALIVANSVAYGARYGLLTVAGTSTAVMLQLALTGLGMTEALGTLGHWFEWLRWIGAAYLVWIGVQQWRAAPVDLTRTAPQPRSARAIFGRAVLVSLTNPKTLLFYGAFFPQFMNPGHTAAAQVLTLSAVFLALAITIDSLWAIAAGRARRVLAVHGRLRNRVSGGMLVGAGVGLALARPK